jgi:uncharacterized protein (DUF1697 family)
VGTYVAMLRGINVGGRNKIKMPDLQALFVGLGHADVITYVQSGNVVFTSPAKSAAALASAIEKQIARDLAIDVVAVLRTKAELAKVIAGNPFVRTRADLAKLHVTFLKQLPGAALVRALDGHRAEPDEFRVLGREIYLHCPAGYGKTKLNNTFWERRLKIAATTRNWNTVTKLFELTGG